MNLFVFIFLFFLISLNETSSKESDNKLCQIRGYEIIFPYEQAILEIKKKFSNIPDKKKSKLLQFKKKFKNNFHGISLYKEAGCSNARLNEYLDCLVSTDGKDCRIYYSQMRILD